MRHTADLKWKASLILALTFLAGGVTGAALNGLYVQASNQAGSGRPPAPLVENLRHELQLTDEQVSAIREAIADTRRGFRGVRFDQCPGFAEARQQLIARVRPLLTPSQQERFSAVIERGPMRGDSPPGRKQ